MSIKKFSALVISVLLLFSGTVSAEGGGIKNVIYMIPDGGGMAPFYLADDLKSAGGFRDGLFPHATKTAPGHFCYYGLLVGSETTLSAHGQITDSAAAGTALSGGYKTLNGYIGVDPDLKPHADIMEISQYLGKATGLVSTYEWMHATPASFSAHAESRTDYPTLSEQIVNQGFDCVLGAGFGAAAWGDISEAERRGYTVIRTRDDLRAVKSGDKIWGDLVSDHFPYDIYNTKETPTLAEMTASAIRALADADPDGFCLLVEGSKVDAGGHANSALLMMSEYLAFDAACAEALRFAESRSDTVVIILPDHDTAGLTVPDGASAVSALIAGDEPAGITWENDVHTARNCGVWMYVPEGTAYPSGLSPCPAPTREAIDKTFSENTVDNTAIARYVCGLFGADPDDVTRSLFVDVTDLGHVDETGAFIFSGCGVSVRPNTATAYTDGGAIDLHGQVALSVGGRFFVPRLLLDSIGKSDRLTLTVNGRSVASADAPYVKNGVAMVPFRAVCEAVGAAVSWDNGTASAKSDSLSISVTAGSDVFTAGGTAYRMAEAAELASGRLFLPADAFGFSGISVRPVG